MHDVTAPQPVYWRSGAFSHPGAVRSANEDAILRRDQQQFWLVADGMGGHRRGDLASQTLVQHLATADMPNNLADAVDALEDGLLAANAAVLHIARTQFTGATMGTTFVAALIRGNLGFVCWAGDSRLYRLRRGELSVLTRDHSRVQELADQGRLTEELKKVSANVITRALGVDDLLPADMSLFTARAGDTFLLCSDGVYNALDQKALLRSLGGENEQQACDLLLTAALANGARDNVSAVVLRPSFEASYAN